MADLPGGLPEDPLDAMETLVGQYISLVFIGTPGATFWGPYKLLGVGEGFLVCQGSGSQRYYINLLSVAVIRPDEGETTNGQ